MFKVYIITRQGYNARKVISESIYPWNILVIGNQNLMLLASSDTKQTLMYIFLFANIAQRELVSICTQQLQLTFLALLPWLYHLLTISKQSRTYSGVLWGFAPPPSWISKIYGFKGVFRIFQWNILVIGNYYVNYQNLMVLASSDTKRMLMHPFLFSNSAQRELV